MISIAYQIYLTIKENYHAPEQASLGFIQTLVHIVQLVVLPLVIAGRYRDRVDVKALPLAGQFLAASQVISILVPVTIAPFINYCFGESDQTELQETIEQVFIVLILTASLYPIRKEISLEWRKCSCRCKKQANRDDLDHSF